MRRTYGQMHASELHPGTTDLDLFLYAHGVILSSLTPKAYILYRLCAVVASLQYCAWA